MKTWWKIELGTKQRHWWCFETEEAVEKIRARKAQQHGCPCTKTPALDRDVPEDVRAETEGQDTPSPGLHVMLFPRDKS